MTEGQSLHIAKIVHYICLVMSTYDNNIPTSICDRIYIFVTKTDNGENWN